MFNTTRVTFLDRLSNHDGQAWDHFAKTYAPLLHAYGRRAGLQDADLDDVSQTVWQSLTVAMPGFRYDPERGRFRDYLGRIAANAVRRYLGRRSRRRESRLDTVFSKSIADNFDHEGAWNSEWRSHHCRLALRTLRRDLEAKSLDVFESLLAGSSVPDVCSEFSLQRDAVYKIRTRVRARLRDEVRVQMEREDHLVPRL